MPAQFIPIGEPAHDAERQALRYLVEGLPDGFVVYGNAWLVERSGPVFEVDAVVVAPHAIYVVEIKSYRGDISGNDNDWYLPQPIRSPLKLNRRTAQVLASLVKHASVEAARPFVEGLVFLSHARDCQIRGPASAERVHTRKTILSALTDPTALWRRENRRPAVDAHAARVIDELLRGASHSNRPQRLIREWQIETTLDRTDRYSEVYATHRITGESRQLRIYDVPALDDDKRRRVEELVRWEAQVLRRIGEHPQVIHADAPFLDEAGFVLPFEAFSGLTLTSWIERHGATLVGAQGVAAKVQLWKSIALALDYAHQQGVVHRLLRPEVVLVENTPEKPQLRVTGFELAKQLYLPGQTVAVSALTDERRRWSAPEVVRSFSDADARSDQFGLGALLGFLLVGRPLFDSTEEMLRRGGAFTRLRDVNPSLKQGLNRAVATMLERASANRFSSLTAAIAAVEDAVLSRPAGLDPAPAAVTLDPDNIPNGTRLGTDYEVDRKLGAGGMATVYAVRHLVSGDTRALKVSRADARAEEALRAERRALLRLDHPNIVRAIDITNVVPGRTSLALERVKGEPLSVRVASGGITDEERRQYAENLLSALAYLETKDVVHKDIKPDNLIVGPDGLTLIDFSLAEAAADETLVGTALYRDPALERWSPVADRYAAALCLFEMWVGRHAFDGQAPAPRDKAHVERQEFDRPALEGVFTKALDPQPSRRYPSAAALRAAILEALGSRAMPAEALDAPAAGIHSSQAPLSASPLSGTAVHCLRRAGITTQGALVALSEGKIRAIQGLGNKKRDEVLALRAALVAAGVAPADLRTTERHPIYPTLFGDVADVHKLDVTAALKDMLVRAGFVTVGRVADATREDLEAAGVTAARLPQLVKALQQFADGPHLGEAPSSLDDLWDRATTTCDGHEKPVLERVYGVRGRRVTQNEYAEEVGVSATTISLAKQRAWDKLDTRVLGEAIDYAESILGAAGGILRIDDAAQRLTERWPVVGDVQPEGIWRLFGTIANLRITCRDILDDEPRELVVQPTFPSKAIQSLLEAARAFATWPPREAAGVRASLQAILPDYPHDPVALATRIHGDLRLTDDGELFESPVKLSAAVGHVLRKARLPISVEELAASVAACFGDAVTPEPTPKEVTEVLSSSAMVAHVLDPATGMVDARAGRSVVAPRVEADPIRVELSPDRDPLEQARDLLVAVSKTRGFRQIVAPPERHVAIGKSVHRALGPEATYVSFEDAFFRRMTGQIDALVRAERYSAQRPRLSRDAEAVLDEIVREHGKPGAKVVLAEVALWGVCDATHLIRKLYVLTNTGGLGFWALVIPGVVRDKQPVFNETPRATVWSLDGALMRIDRELPGTTESTRKVEAAAPTGGR